MKVLIDVRPLSSGHAVRGVGMYTRFLTEALEKKKKVGEFEIYRSGLEDLPKADIIHYPFFDLFFTTLPFRRKGRTVVTIHDVIPLLFPKQYLFYPNSNPDPLHQSQQSFFLFQLIPLSSQDLLSSPQIF